MISLQFNLLAKERLHNALLIIYDKLPYFKNIFNWWRPGELFWIIADFDTELQRKLAHAGHLMKNTPNTRQVSGQTVTLHNWANDADRLSTDELLAQ